MALYSTSITVGGLALDLLEGYGNGDRGRYVGHILKHYGTRPMPKGPDDQKRVRVMRMRLDEQARAKLETIAPGDRSRYVAALIRAAFEDAKAAAIELLKVGLEREEIGRAHRMLGELQPRRDAGIGPALAFGAAEHRVDADMALAAQNVPAVAKWLGALMRAVPPLEGAVAYVLDDMTIVEDPKDYPEGHGYRVR